MFHWRAKAGNSPLSSNLSSIWCETHYKDVIYAIFMPRPVDTLKVSEVVSSYHCDRVVWPKEFVRFFKYARTSPCLKK